MGPGRTEGRWAPSRGANERIFRRSPKYPLDLGLRAVPAPGASEPGISIVIPAWNEEDRLARTLERYLPALESRGDPFEVVVVVDGVRDRTAEVATRYVSRRVRVLLFPHKLGKGGAVLAGIKVSRYEYVGYLDADGPISPEEMYGMIDYLNGDVDCVVASRWTRGASGVREEPLFNRIAGRGWNFLTRSLLFLPNSRSPWWLLPLDLKCSAAREAWSA